MPEYTISENKCLIENTLKDIEQRIYNLEQFATCSPGDTRTIDNIECLCVNKNPLLFVDKNHDLCWYFYGDDFVKNNNDITNGEKWSYNYGIVSNFPDLTSYSVGEGLKNTNIFISLNPSTLQTGYDTIWSKIIQFRKSHSDNWFLPSGNELELLKSYLINGDIQNFSHSNDWSLNYWTSTRVNVNTAVIYSFIDNSMRNQGALLDDFDHASDKTHTRLFYRPYV